MYLYIKKKKEGRKRKRKNKQGCDSSFVSHDKRAL